MAKIVFATLKDLMPGDIIVATREGRVRKDQRCTVLHDVKSRDLYIDADPDKKTGKRRLNLSSITKDGKVQGFTLSLKSDVRKGQPPK